MEFGSKQPSHEFMDKHRDKLLTLGAGALVVALAWTSRNKLQRNLPRLFKLKDSIKEVGVEDDEHILEFVAEDNPDDPVEASESHLLTGEEALERLIDITRRMIDDDRMLEYATAGVSPEEVIDTRQNIIFDLIHQLETAYDDPSFESAEKENIPLLIAQLFAIRNRRPPLPPNNDVAV